MRKVRVEINEIVNRKTIEKSQQNQKLVACSLKISTKIDKSLVVLIRKEREKIQGAYGGSVS